MNMKLTDITQQVKNTNRYSYFVDGKYSFSLGQQQARECGLRIGQELDEPAVQFWKQQSTKGKQWDLVLGWIARRQRSVKETRDYLTRKQLEPDRIDEFVERLLGLKYLNDESFAQMWVRNRRELKNSSKRKIQAELRSKGVSHDLIELALNEHDETDQSALLECLQKRAHRYDDEQKLIAYLARQGFGYADIKEALQTFKQE